VTALLVGWRKRSRVGRRPRPFQVGQQADSADSTPDYPILVYQNGGFGIPDEEIDVAANPNTTCTNPDEMIVEGRDWTNSNSWAWSPYEYPHPLRSEAEVATTVTNLTISGGVSFGGGVSF